MSSITITSVQPGGMTLVSNYFIDNYMKDANDLQLKIYFYLLRSAGTTMPAGICDMADLFNHTEKDVVRALKYWDKLHVISLITDPADSKKLVGIRLEDLSANMQVAVVPSQAKAEPIAVPEVSAPQPEMVAIFPTAPEAPAPQPAVFDKSTITLDQLKEFKGRSETSQLMFIIEQYLGRNLTATDIRSIFFITDVLHFSMDLMDYLVQYCVERGKKDFRYIEKVAISWSENHITTPKQAASYARKYDKNVYTIMNELGKSGTPTAREMDFITSWLKDGSFTIDVLKEACQRTVLATDKHRFEYADSIIQNWKKSGVHSMADVRNADEAFQKKKATPSRTTSQTNAFNQFPQRQYDYEALLEKMKIN